MDGRLKDKRAHIKYAYWFKMTSLNITSELNLWIHSTEGFYSYSSAQNTILVFFIEKFRRISWKILILMKFFSMFHVPYHPIEFVKHIISQHWSSSIVAARTFGGHFIWVTRNLSLQLHHAAFCRRCKLSTWSKCHKWFKCATYDLLRSCTINLVWFL